MLFSLLVLDASETRQTGMDIWRESGNRLAVLMPAPQKCSYILMSAHTPTHTHISTPSYQLSRALSHPYFLLSDYLRTCSVRASWEFWNLLDFPSSLSAKGRRPGRRLDRSRKCPPTEREDGTADIKAIAALFKEQSTVDCLPPSHLCVCMFCLVWVRVSSFRVCFLVPVLTAGLEILSKSHRLTSV